MQRLPGRAGVTIAAALMCVLQGCGGGGGGNNNGGGNGPPTQPPPAQSQTVTITFVSRNLDANADAGQLYVHVGDAAITRATMAATLNENAPTVRLVPGSSRNTATLAVPRGKTVTVIAVEFSTNGWVIPQTGTPFVATAPRSEVEWVGWEGNPSQPEEGVAVVLADGDKEVTALFDRVQGLTFRAIGCTPLKIQTTNTKGLLSFGRIVRDSVPDLTSSNAFTETGRLQPEYDVAFMYGKQGSLFTLRGLIREDRSPNVLRSGFIRWDGSATACGTSLNCQVPVPSKANAPNALAMRMIRGYSLRQGVYGCNCNPLTPNIPCTMLP